jgi:hypothetical protein
MPTVPVMLTLAAAVAILGGVLAAALGRAGEMALVPGDFPPVDSTDLTAAQVFMLRPPMAMWGYHAGACEEAWRLIARSMADREAQIAVLREELAGLRAAQAGEAPDVVSSGD